MSKSIIVKGNKNPEIKFLKVSVICWCFAGQGEEVELPLVGTMAHAMKEQRKTQRARWPRANTDQIKPTRSSRGISKGAKTVLHPGLAVVEKLWSGKANRDGHACLVWRSRKGQRWSLLKETIFQGRVSLAFSSFNSGPNIPANHL